MRRNTPGQHRRRTSIRTAVSVGIAAAAVAATAVAATAEGATPAPQAQRTQHVEYFNGADGHPRQTTVPASKPLAPSEKAAIAAGDGDVTSIVQNGTVGTKLDVVFIGDGYTAAQQEDFHADVRAKWAKISGVEPYATYRGLFNVWAVDAVSNESGVSGDPTKDVVRDTALDSAFFCDNTERLLCVDTGKVESYASKAPAADLVVVLSNSTKYGGAGYNDISSQVGYDGIATASSDNDQSDQIAVHETGHSLGKLADEYDYGQSGTYTGPEPAQTNLTKLSADQMTAQQQKWYRWIGQQSPDGGAVGAFEGGGYYQVRAQPSHRQLDHADPGPGVQPPRPRGDDRGLLPLCERAEQPGLHPPRGLPRDPYPCHRTRLRAAEVVCRRPRAQGRARQHHGRPAHSRCPGRRPPPYGHGPGHRPYEGGP
ncbi:M64 family metallopeptidase [Streptomyces libani]